jgi:hypothetical protein
MKRIRDTLMAAVFAACLLTGCTSAQQNLALDTVSLAVNTVAVVDPAVSPMLTAAAKVACDGQAVANAAGDSKVSAALGEACTW